MILLYLYSFISFSKLITVDKPNHNIIFKPHFISNLHNNRNIDHYNLYKISYNAKKHNEFQASFIYNSDIRLFGISPVIHEDWSINNTDLVCKLSSKYGSGTIIFTQYDTILKINILITSDSIPIKIKNHIAGFILNTCINSLGDTISFNAHNNLSIL